MMFSFLKYIEQTRPRYLSLLKKFIKHLLSLNHGINNSNSSKQKAYPLESLLEVYGINPHLYPKQSGKIAQICEEYSMMRSKEIIKLLYRPIFRLFLFKHERYIRYEAYKKLHEFLALYTSIQLGARPEQSSLESINEYHRIAKPKYCPLSATSYLVSQRAAVKWKRKALAPNILAIDQIPWQLYKDEQVKLRIVTLPCATATYKYLKYSVRRC